MGRPAKPYAVIIGEGKSHRTKAELEAKKKGEAAFATGQPIKEKPETKKNVVAHKEFLRLKKLLESIGKWDAIYENIINRYCSIYAECIEFEKYREDFYKDLWDMEDHRDDFFDGTADKTSTFYKLKSEMQKSIIDLDKQVQAKRKMLMDIEKENVMTIQSALRNIPKQEESAANPLLEALKGG